MIFRANPQRPLNGNNAIKKKRLNHFADAIIGILTGYQMNMDFYHFERRGSGTYVLDLLNKTVRFNQQNIDHFPVFLSVQRWFDREQAKSMLNQAQVIVQVDKNDAVYHLESRFLFFKIKKKIKIPRYQTHINVILKSADKDYSKQIQGLLY